jgi:hypothetical protein
MGDTSLVIGQCHFLSRHLPVIAYLKGGRDTALCQGESLEMEAAVSGLGTQGSWMLNGKAIANGTKQLVGKSTVYGRFR